MEVNAAQAKEIRELVEKGADPDYAYVTVTQRKTKPETNAYSDTPKKNKFGAKKVVIDGITFDSLKEGNRYRELKCMEDAGEIVRGSIEPHPKFEFKHNGVKIGTFTPDFRYSLRNMSTVVEDVKGGNATKTEAYRLRKKMLLAFHGIELKEV